ncbi:MAG TPA: STAS domain-containing protein [Terracidiphilus sp.]|nr:STAS domain-containing protein [Terracidiphilus sp.]
MLRDDPLTIECREGSRAGTRILRISGPVTLPNLPMFQDAVRKGDIPKVSILDLSGVPYMDSAGMGAVINYFTHCQRNGIRMMVAGVGTRVSELFKMTQVDKVMPIVATVDEAESRLS